MTARLSRTLCLSLAGLFVWACTDLRDDGFTSQITHRCATPKGCDEALKDAKARVDKCPDATSSECLAVKEDLASVERLNKRHQDEAKAREEGARKADEELAKARAQEEASRANAKTLEEQVTGHAADIDTWPIPLVTSPDTYSKCGVPPRITQPSVTTPAYFLLWATRLARGASSHVPGHLKTSMSLSLTPWRTRASSAPANSASVMNELKRLTQMAKRPLGETSAPS